MYYLSDTYMRLWLFLHFFVLLPEALPALSAARTACAAAAAGGTLYVIGGAGDSRDAGRAAFRGPRS